MSFDEFLQIMNCKFSEVDPDQIVNCFKAFDKDRNGTVEAKEIKQILKKMGEPLNERQINEVLSEAIVDGEGKIKYEKFVGQLLEQYVV